jgi:hypothetical protein
VSRLNRDWVAGAMLLVVGFLLLGDRLYPELVPIAPLGLGLCLLAIFLVGRSAGALLDGSVSLGIGVGILVVRGGDADFGAAGFLISVSGGFYLAWVLGLLFNIREVRWWPVVPGSLFLAAGAAAYAAGMGRSLLRIAVDWWPALLVAMGAYLILGERLRTRSTPEEETSEVPSAIPPAGGQHDRGTPAQPGPDAAPPGVPETPTPPAPPQQVRPEQPLSAASGGVIGGDPPGGAHR